MPIRFSVVVPTYRRPALLLRCLQALAMQQYEQGAFEVVVVSDGPDPETLEAVTPWMNNSAFQVRYFPLAEKKGPAAARNAGWQQAAGELIAFTDDDCRPDPGWLTALWNAFRNNKGLAFAGRTVVPVDPPPSDFARNTQGLETAAFITANCACAKAILQQVQGFDERYTMAWREDSDLEFSLTQHNIPVIRINEAVVVHPVRDAPWGVSLKEQRKGMFDALLYKKYPSLFRKFIQPQPAWNYYAMIACLVVASGALATGSLWITGTALLTWKVLMSVFMYRRLHGTLHTFRHITEMVVTSVAIPFLSVYWHWYGAVKFRVLFF